MCLLLENIIYRQYGELMVIHIQFWPQYLEISLHLRLNMKGKFFNINYNKMKELVYYFHYQILFTIQIENND